MMPNEGDCANTSGSSASVIVSSSCAIAHELYCRALEL